MKQEGDNSNNFQIGRAGTGNTFNVSHGSRSLRDEVIPLSVNVRSRQVPITNEAVTRRSLVTIFLSVILPLVALLADVLGILAAFHLNNAWFWPIYGGLVGIFIRSNWDHLQIFFRRGEIKRKDTYIGDSKIAHLNSNGTFTLYKRTARCRYPNCNGFIEIVTPPPKEKERCFLAGKCTVCGIAHSYRVDPNWIAYPYDLDWSKENPSH